jgi:hypothetical protein
VVHFQSDIEAIAASGITHIRVPVGYWIVDIQPGEPFVAGGWTYLERLLQWAKQAGYAFCGTRAGCMEKKFFCLMGHFFWSRLWEFCDIAVSWFLTWDHCKIWTGLDMMTRYLSFRHTYQHGLSSLFLLWWVRLQAVVDLHGAPGSQNGQDNSGYAGPVNWPTPSNINRTVYDLGLIAEKIVALNNQPETLNVVSGIELLNEPRTVAVC